MLRITEDDLSPDQRVAFDQVVEWLEDPSYTLTLGGYAGTGKSTLVSLFAQRMDLPRTRFAAPTGKAAMVLRAKFAAQGMHAEVSTIHSLIYKVRNGAKGTVDGYDRRQSLEGVDLIVLDEASMVDRQVHEDLSRFEIPILAVGDHGQLPPVGDAGCMMENPHVRLEAIHRQAEGNPIVALSRYVREEGELPDAFDGKFVRRVRMAHRSEAVRATFAPYRVTKRSGVTSTGLGGAQVTGKASAGRTRGAFTILDAVVLCRTNRMRHQCNDLARKELGMGEAPEQGDLVVCLKNARRLDVWNGMRGRVLGAAPSGDHLLDLEVGFEGFPAARRVVANRHQLGRDLFQSWDDLERCGHKVSNWDSAGVFFDWGYALTVHKAQGSSWPQVVVVDDGGGAGDEDRGRWLYTAVTRSSKYLVVVAEDEVEPVREVW